VSSDIRFPISGTNAWTSGPHVPRVSTAKGQNSCAGINSAYFVDLGTSASIAADSTALDVFVMCDGASVLVHVKSHRRERPLNQGIKVTTSGLLPLGLLLTEKVWRF